MKRLTSCAGLLPVVLLSLFVSSCIYDAPGDKFYRTLWVSDESVMAIGPDEDLGIISAPDSGYSSGSVQGLISDISASQLPIISDFTIEFLCDGIVSIRAKGTAGSYGSYEPQGNTAYFAGLHLTLRTSGFPTTIIIEQATRHNDLLEINWHLSGSSTSHLTTLSRKSSYN